MGLAIIAYVAVLHALISLVAPDLSWPAHLGAGWALNGVLAIPWWAAVRVTVGWSFVQPPERST